MRRSFRRVILTPLTLAGAVVVATGTIIGLPLLTQSAGAVSGAAFTSTDVMGVTHTGSVRTLAGTPTHNATTGAFAGCLNGNSHGTTVDVNNCNLYPNKDAVWLNGGPTAGEVGAGTYFFAVVAPGGQNNANDGAPTNLSNNGSYTTGGTWTQREFTVTGSKTSGYAVTYNGTHGFDSATSKIQLAHYLTTPNPGGVYILAICQITPGYDGSPPVTPSDCKYDAFKVRTAPTGTTTPAPPAAVPAVTKTAVGFYTNSWTWSVTKSVTAATVDSSAPYTFNYTVTVTHTGPTAIDVTVTGTIDVTDPNFTATVPATTTPLTLSSITDELSTGTTCTVTVNGTALLTEGGTSVQSSTLHLTSFNNYFPYSCSLGALPGSTITNTVTAAWSTQTLTNGSHLTTGTASFTFTNVPFTATTTTMRSCVDVDDPVGGGDLGTVCATTPSPKTFHYPNSLGTPGTCTSLTNTVTLTTSVSGAELATATTTVHVCVGTTLEVSKTATPHFKRTYDWSITKTVNHTTIDTSSSGTFTYAVLAEETGFTDSTWTVTGTITVTNPNNWESITATITDAISNGGTCSVATGTGVVVAATATITRHYTCSYASAPTTATGHNTATATWSSSAAHTPNTSATGKRDATFTTPTAVAATSITPTDAFNGGSGTELCTLDPGTPCTLTATNGPSFTSQTYTYMRTESATAGSCTTYGNTAATGLTGPGQTSSKTVKVCVGKTLTVSKTATPHFKRTYHWSITKSVTPTKIESSSGGTFKYTVVAKETGFTDSTWTVTGTVTVTNPNNWESVTVTITDAISNGGSCSVTNGTGVVIPASSTVKRHYSCTYSTNQTGVQEKNTATATWSASAAFTTKSSATGNATATFTTPTKLATTSITPTDAFNMGSAVKVCTLEAGTPCTLTAKNVTPYTSQTYTYSRVIAATPNTCVTYTNTASTGLKGTGQTSSKTVTLCGAVTGGLTMGFWQNMNGQGIITGSAVTSVTHACKLTSYLRMYKPFKDLSASANCTAVAKYVYTLIKAANAGGAAMNPMLKAQMLATALDVYFSTPDLGGNKISFHTSKPAASCTTGTTCGLGAVTVDLTNIFGQNVEAAFTVPPASSSQTVDQLLNEASSHSNTGGTQWYLKTVKTKVGGTKSIQGLAKNTFTAINNGTAFA